MPQPAQVSKNNMAFKCTYHDGVGGFKNVGFFGTCSEQNIKRNIDEGRDWCSQPGNKCFKYYKERGFEGDPPQFPCSEGGLFKSWSFDCGVYHKGKKYNQGIPVSNHWEKENHIAVLTTRLPDTEESERKIFGYYTIKKISPRRKPTDYHTVSGDEETFIILPLPRENWLNFWDYHRNSNGGKEWKTGLFRYLSDKQIALILQSFYDVVKSPDERLIISNDIEDYRQRLGGTLPRLNPEQQEKIDDVQIENKYGPRGEGKAHKALKNFVFNNPECIGLKPTEIKKPHVEFGFMTGDRVDVAFELVTGEWVVIEIEIEGEMNNTIGMAQAVKYRSLMEVEKGFDQTQGVRAYLVAHSIPESVRGKCEKYSVAFKEISKQSMAKTIVKRLKENRTL